MPQEPPHSGPLHPSRQGQLFDYGVQAWVHADERIDPQTIDQRRALLASLADSNLGTIEQRVVDVLQRYPETRDDRRLLVLRYWYRFNTEVIAAWQGRPGRELDLLLQLDNFTTIDRIARHIQNTLKLYSGEERYKRFRIEKQVQFSRYLAEQRKHDPEIRLFLDETGTDSQSRYVAVAGVCAADWRQYEKYHAAMEQWRRGLKFPRTLHAADITNDNSLHMALLNQVGARKGGLLFVGHAIETPIATSEALLSLFLHLTLDTLRYLADNGCLNEPKGLVLTKESDDAFDNFYLSSLIEHLEDALVADFPEQVYLKNVQALPKGREVMLEIADHIAFALQRGRRAPSRHPKDVVADAALNVTGLDDPRERGVVFKLWR